METACNRCRRILVVRRHAKEVVCPSCYSWISVPSHAQYRSGVRDRMKSLGTQLKTTHHGIWGPVHMTTSPAPTPPSLSYPSLPVRSNKRALLIGVSEKDRKYELGVVGDVKRMMKLLILTYNFPMEEIRVLTGDEPHPKCLPTKKNIIESMHLMVEGCRRGDSLVFYFSGHGSQEPDFDGDESDCRDETIIPSDVLEAGQILDDRLNSIMVSRLKEGVTLHAIVDACHSGTILDLPYKYIGEKNWWKENRSGVYKGTSGGVAISIGACEDYQLAASTDVFTGKPVGALTYMLKDILNHMETCLTAWKSPSMRLTNAADSPNCSKIQYYHLPGILMSTEHISNCDCLLV